MAPFSISPKLKLKRDEEEDEEPSPFQLSLSLPFPNPSSTTTTTTTTTKPHSSCSTNYMLHHVFAGSMLIVSVILTKRFLTWCSQKKHASIVVWNNLPPELCEKIGKCIESRLDIVRFRSVCKNFRSSLPSPTRFPLRVPPLPNCAPVFHDFPFMVTEVDYYKVKYELTHVALEEVDQGGKFHPFWNYVNQVSNSLEHPPLSQLSFVSKAYHLRIVAPRLDIHRTAVVEGQFDCRSSIRFAKKVVIVSSNATIGVNPSYVRASDLSVVAHLSSGRLALLRLGVGGSFQSRVWDTDFCSQVYEAIGSYRGRLCALDPLGRVLVMDYESLQMSQLTPPSSVAGEVPDKQLFEAFGDLYLARAHGNETYKFSFHLQEWIRISVVVNPEVIRVLAPLLLFV